MGIGRVPLFVSQTNGLKMQQTFTLELFESKYLHIAEILSGTCHSFAFVPSTKDEVSGMMCEAIRIQQLPSGRAELELEAKAGEQFVLCGCVKDHKSDLMFAEMATASLETSSEAAKQLLITDAIQQGAPMYNAGRVRECAGHYQAALTQLCGLSHGPEGQFARIKLRKAKEAANDDKRAWVLRETLDALLVTDNSPRSTARQISKPQNPQSKSKYGDESQGRLFSFNTGSKTFLASIAKHFVAINDTVMGGSSRSSIRDMSKFATSSGELIIRGGGFASVAARSTRGWDLSAGGATALVLFIRRGDGRRYKLCLRNELGTQAVTYQHSFNSFSDWSEVELPFSSFAASWRGGRVPGAEALDASSVVR
jgi:hypothetical protein